MVIIFAGLGYTFVFEGIDSGLRIPAISRWPASKAFSFCTWIKVEIPKRNKSTKGKLLEYQPYILSVSKPKVEKVEKTFSTWLKDKRSN
jgi:hypothetical protein